MKKLVLTSVCVLAMTGAAFAQGKVNWSSISASAMTAQTNSTTYSPLFGGGAAPGGAVGATSLNGGALGFYYELLYSAFTGVQAAKPTTLASLGTWQDSGLSASNSITSAGRLVPVNPGTSVNVPWASGITNSVMMVGWSGNLGSTWAIAQGNLNNSAFLASLLTQAFVGLSNTGFINPGTADPGVTVFATAAGPQGLPINSLLTQLNLIPVPEPGTMALAALGGASLLLFRRKK